jgi:uncharacterized protein RhaS with RHS repeats
MQARYYDPLLARFYSNDPLGFRDVHSFNRYAYANNNPYRYTDPTGERPEFLAGTGVGISFSERDAGIAAEAEASVDNNDFSRGVEAGQGFKQITGDIFDGVGFVAAVMNASKLSLRQENKPAFSNSKEAEKGANELGYSEDKGSGKIKGEKIFKNKKVKGGAPKFITRDTDGHTGGAFKGADKAKDLGSNKTRKGTYNKKLEKIAK